VRARGFCGCKREDLAFVNAMLVGLDPCDSKVNQRKVTSMRFDLRAVLPLPTARLIALQLAMGLKSLAQHRRVVALGDKGALDG